MNEIQIFNFNDNQVRVIEKDGEPWWVAKDVCDYFGDSNYRRQTAGLDEDEKGVSQINTPGGIQSMTVINESGLYSLLFAMQPEKARGVSDEYIVERQEKIQAFKRWVTHEVIPSVRKHGAYMTPETIEKTLLNPDFIIGLAQNLKAEQQKNAQLTAKVEQDAPKVLFADSVSASNTDILIGELAKLLKQNGYEIGQNRLFEQLRADGFLMKTGSSRNMPTQKAMEMGLFRVQEATVNKPDGTPVITKTTKVTGRGQLFFVNRFVGVDRTVAA